MCCARAVGSWQSCYLRTYSSQKTLASDAVTIKTTHSLINFYHFPPLNHDYLRDFALCQVSAELVGLRVLFDNLVPYEDLGTFVILSIMPVDISAGWSYHPDNR